MAGVAERVLQSPLVWMNLRKSRVAPVSVPLCSGEGLLHAIQCNAVVAGTD